MTAPNRQNLWMCATTTERDALNSGGGTAVGDFCLVEGLNLYVAVAVTGGGSTWRPLGGVPTAGVWGLGGKNYDLTTNRSVFMLTGVTFSAVLDAVPSSITLTTSNQLNWTTGASVVQLTANGFAVSGTSLSVTPNTNAWVRGTYTINY